MTSTEQVILIAAITAAVGAVVTVYINNKLEGEPQNANTQSASQQPGLGMPGSAWTHAGVSAGLSQEPQMEVYAGPGRGSSRSNFNGAIWASRFNSGGNPNAGGGGSDETSWAFQSATKNPYANGTNKSYAKAVVTATQDPTNQVTSLVLGAGVAPNNPAA